MSSLRLRTCVALCAWTTLAWCPFLTAQPPQRDLSSASIEELLEMRVTTVAKREQPLSAAAAAVYVITGEDIRRSGVETLAEALRLAPGVEVAQFSANTWAISIRGFNSRFANKLLVLIDGRTVYSPTYSGVFWNEQDLLLEDIERIEVIRGPGATMWGTNAVNGVINIITRPAEETEGALLGAGAGTLQSLSSYARYGGTAGKRGHYRVYANHARRVDLPMIQGRSADDGWTTTRGGFRSDWRFDQANSFTVQGDGSGGQPYETTPVTITGFPGYPSFAGGNLLARWSHVARSSELRIQAYYDQARENFPGIVELRHDSFDLDLQHNIALGARHNVVWGGTFRNVRQRSWGTPIAWLVPAARSLRTFSGFVQDEIALRSRSLYLIAGSKFESNEFTGVEIQPTVRVLFTPSRRQALWAAVSRAMRSPSEVEIGIRNLLPMMMTQRPTLAFLIGNAHGRSEELLSYEMGYRTQAGKHLSLDVAAFVNRYQHLSALVLASSPPPAPGIIPLTMAYNSTGRTYGVELSVAYAPARVWRLSGSYTWLRPVDPFAAGIKAYPGSGDPHHQFQVHSLLSLPRRVEVDSHLYFVGAQPEMAIRRYTRFDVRLGWTSNEHLEWSLVGQNLLDSAHPEFSTGNSAPIEVRRSVFAKMTWRF
ncbi:MAG TPA: TonB-dependent receptor [Terriglobales bacterium]|nr:TonB-dependent receptor [Terriglobales bacterium]